MFVHGKGALCTYRHFFVLEEGDAVGGRGADTASVSRVVKSQATPNTRIQISPNFKRIHVIKA